MQVVDVHTKTNETRDGPFTVTTDSYGRPLFLTDHESLLIPWENVDYATLVEGDSVDLADLPAAPTESVP